MNDHSSKGNEAVKESGSADFKRALVIRGGALGDFVLTLPILRCLVGVAPEAEVDVLGYPEIAQLAVEGGLARRAHRVDSPLFAPLFSEKPGRCDALAEWLGKFDLVVSVWRDPESRLVRRLRELGVKEPLHIEPIPPEGGRAHAVDYMLEQLPAKWQRKSHADASLAVSAASRQRAKEYVLQNLGLRASRLFAIHPGSGGRGKNRNWPADRFAKVVKRALAEDDSACFIIRGPADDHAVREVQRDMQAVSVPIAAGLKPAELAAVLSSAQAVVGNDSGVTHLAAALGVKTIAIFGATDGRVWGPRGARVRVLQGSGGDIESVSVSQVVKELGL